ncbi:acyltransferase family protein [Membranihabitans maritimus]|uniref:acyltransferase family protein n=1 Tax=Membranihabitans maritimus TaxID=2904244 RepID=UPI001F32191D|nr:DUF5009 domain-containing protein [Membranihabitans maritimus]
MGLQKSQNKQYNAGNQSKSVSKRLDSLDALRGFDMFLIIGGTYLISTFIDAMNWTSLGWLTAQFKHVPWHGLTFEDVIFPLFLFMVGVSMVYSIASSRKKGLSDQDIYIKAFKRMLLLSVLGIIYKNRPLHFDLEEIRFVSVLGRIGVTGFIGTLIVMNTNIRGQIYWLAGLLIFYWLSMLFIPVPGYGAGDLSQEGNLAGFIDRIIVPGRLKDGNFDELGYFEHIPSIGLVLMGALAAHILRKEIIDIKKVTYLGIIGAGCILGGIIWNFHFPINKHLWSSSFIMVTGGISFLFLALFYQIIDVWGFKKWSFVFKIIGLNSIFIYLASALIDFRYTSNYLFNGFFEMAGEDGKRFLLQLSVLLLEVGLLYFLYKKRIFFKV